VPGKVNGSCSFATAGGRRLQFEHLATAQLVGTFAFEAARRLVRRDHQKQGDPARFSDRKRDCLTWVARGKSDSEIATILGISPETVHQYVKQARANCNAVSRSQLVAHALFSGTISFMDIFKR
jgi:LuxR family quorum-sensing system transcriptional regulator CciR